MGIPIPVICENPDCNHVWFATSMFSVGQGTTVNVINSRFSPCPRCKGIGKVPDGRYTSTSANLFNKIECNLIVSALKHLQEKVLQGESIAETQTEVIKQFPFLSGLFRFLPKDSSQLAAWVAIFVMVFLHYSGSKHDEPSRSVHVDINISKALEQISADLKTNQQNNQDQNKEQQKDKDKKDLDSSDIQE